MENNDFVIKKLQYYLENFEGLSDAEMKQANYFVLYKANEQININIEMNAEIQEQNERILEQNHDLKDTVLHYRQFIEDSRLTKRFELYCKGKEVI